MADYTTAPETRALVTDSDFVGDSSYDAVLNVLITAASRMIDKYVGGWDNYFYPDDSETEVRYFDGSGEKQQWIDPAVSISEVAVDDYGEGTYLTWTLNTHYIVWPYNYQQIGRPIQRLDIPRNSSKGTFMRWHKSVRVTGVFGYSTEPPEMIQMACKIQASRWFMRAKGGFEDAQASAAVGQMFYTKELDPDVKMLLESYRMENTAI